MNILGLMTGSSADGLDICLVRFQPEAGSCTYQVLFSAEESYPPEFRKVFSNPLQLTDAEIKRLHIKLGKWFVKTLDKFDLSFDAIASHGQTIKHEPPYFSLQIGDPSFMAERFKVPVIYDFRTADIQAGGQGAPLIPIVDKFLFQHASRFRLALNIGGIANLTFLPPRESSEPVLAWDIGPGNTLIDKAVKAFTLGHAHFDRDGSIAAQGRADEALLKYLLEHEFYTRRPPKSAGQEQFGEAYFKLIMNRSAPRTEQDFRDLIHTLTLLTVKTIGNAARQRLPSSKADELYISGGGSFNLTLVNLLKRELPDIHIMPVDLKGVDTGNKEAFGFAYLAYLRLLGLPGNLPSVTGAQRTVLLGEIYRPS